MRYLFGFSGDSLTSGAVDDGAVDDGAERDAGEEVEADITARIAAQSLRSYRRWRKTRSNALDSSVPAIFSTQITDLEPLEPIFG